jgi:hypothetical protein
MTRMKTKPKPPEIIELDAPWEIQQRIAARRLSGRIPKSSPRPREYYFLVNPTKRRSRSRG